MKDPKSFRQDLQSTGRSTAQARSLRKELTPPEQVLWVLIKRKKLDGFRFRKQVAIGPYIADFYCHAARLVVEVDGKMHHGKQLEHDHKRDRWMQAKGLYILRFGANDVFLNREGVLDRIRTIARDRKLELDGLRGNIEE